MMRKSIFVIGIILFLVVIAVVSGITIKQPPTTGGIDQKTNHEIMVPVSGSDPLVARTKYCNVFRVVDRYGMTIYIAENNSGDYAGVGGVAACAGIAIAPQPVPTASLIIKETGK